MSNLLLFIQDEQCLIVLYEYKVNLTSKTSKMPKNPLINLRIAVGLLYNNLLHDSPNFTGKKVIAIFDSRTKNSNHQKRSFFKPTTKNKK